MIFRLILLLWIGASIGISVYLLNEKNYLNERLQKNDVENPLLAKVFIYISFSIIMIMVLPFALIFEVVDRIKK